VGRPKVLPRRRRGGKHVQRKVAIFTRSGCYIQWSRDVGTTKRTRTKNAQRKRGEGRLTLFLDGGGRRKQGECGNRGDVIGNAEGTRKKTRGRRTSG